MSASSSGTAPSVCTIEQLARPHLQVDGEGGGVATLLDCLLERLQSTPGVACGDRVHRSLEQARVGHAEHGEHVLERDLAAAVGDELLERAERVAKAPRGRARDGGDGRGRDLDRLRGGRAAHDGSDLLDAGTVEVEAMATVDHGGRDLVRLGRGEHEHRVGRRLLQRLQKGVPGGSREHVRLVEDVDLAPPADGGVGDALAQVADVVDGVVGGRVHLDHVQRGGARDRQARLAFPAGVDRAAARAVQAGGEDLCHRGLARAARADEQVGVVDLVPFHGMAQRPHHGLLPDHLGECAGSVPAVKRALLE